MRKKTMRTKALCLVTTCCFLSAVHLSPARALEQQHKPLFQVSDRISCEELWQNLISSSSPGNKAFLNEGMPDNIRAAALDLPGLIVLYNIFMFIHYGRLCLETLDPAPCEAMVTHLLTALFLGILLEGF